MLVPVAYATVIIVWATTPLMVQWSSQGTEFLWAAFLRMLTAAVCGFVLLGLFRKALPFTRPAMLSYLSGVVGVFGAMGCVYASAGELPSGMISLIFGLMPVATGILASRIIDEPLPGRLQWAGIATCIGGLAIVALDGTSTGKASITGITLVLLSVLLFSTSSIMVKKIDAGLHPLQQTVGTIALSVPFYGGTVWAFGSGFSITGSSALAIVYLALLGSIGAFMSYYYILHRLPATAVSLPTVIAPVFAVALGSVINGEALTAATLAGMAVLIAGLAIYLFINKKGSDMS